MRRTVSILTMLLCVFVTGDGAQSLRAACPSDAACFLQRESPPESLVRVTNQLAPNKRDYGSGSLIEEGGRQWVLTAAHVFWEGVGNIFVTTQRNERVSAEVAVHNPFYDVALLTLDRRISLRPIRVATTPAVQGERSVGWGFGPNGRLQGVSGTVVGYAKTSKSEFHETLKTTGKARQGDSGGAILNEKGELIGLLWGTDGRHTYSTFCGRLRKIINGTQPPRAPAQEPGASAPGWPEQPTAPIRAEPLRGLTPPALAPSPALEIQPILQTSLIEKTALAIGYSTPPSMALYYVLYGIFVRKSKKRRRTLLKKNE